MASLGYNSGYKYTVLNYVINSLDKYFILNKSSLTVYSNASCTLISIGSRGLQWWIQDSFKASMETPFANTCTLHLINEWMEWIVAVLYY